MPLGKIEKNQTQLLRPHNGLVANDGKELATLLNKHPALTLVNISHNRLGNKGISYLANELKTNKNLTTLYMLANEVTADGVEALTAALSFNTTLRTLDIADNQPGNNGTFALANMIRQNHTLTDLNLSWCRFNLEHAQTLVTALSDNTTLVSFKIDESDVYNVHINLAVIPTIDKLLYRNKLISHLKIIYTLIEYSFRDTTPDLAFSMQGIVAEYLTNDYNCAPIFANNNNKLTVSSTFAKDMVPIIEAGKARAKITNPDINQYENLRGNSASPSEVQFKKNSRSPSEIKFTTNAETKNSEPNPFTTLVAQINNARTPVGITDALYNTPTTKPYCLFFKQPIPELKETIDTATSLVDNFYRETATTLANKLCSMPPTKPSTPTPSR